MEKYDFDVVIIGSGPGGYMAAIFAAQKGLNVAVIEKDKIGGVCLNVGCIPSKALIHCSEIFHHMQQLQDWGIKCDLSQFDYSRVTKHIQQSAKTLSKSVESLLKRHRISFIKGTAAIVDNHRMLVDRKRMIQTQYIVIATGSLPRELPGFHFDKQKLLSSTELLELKKLPKSMMVLGGGAIGVEMTHAMNRFGVDVTLVEFQDRLLPLEDKDISKQLATIFTKRGVQVLTSTKALSVSYLPSGKLRVRLEKHLSEVACVSMEVEQILIAVGRVPNVNALGLDSLNIQLDTHGFIQVDRSYRTSIPNIYAIGDIVRQTPLLAHVAYKEAELAIQNITGVDQDEFDMTLIPSVTYCEPQVASFGMHEEQIKQQNLDYQKLVFPYKGLGKAVSADQTDGFLKVLCSPLTHEILGVHMIGAQASELIHEFLLARSSELTPEDIARMIHAHPTFSEIAWESMRSMHQNLKQINLTTKK